MDRFQLRLRHGRTPDDLVDELSHGLWRTLGWHAEFDFLHPHVFTRLLGAVRSALKHSLRAYPICQTCSAYDQKLESTPWTPPWLPGTINQDPGHANGSKHIFVEVPSDLDDIAKEIEMAVHDSFIKNYPERHWLAPLIRPEIHDLVRRVMGPYLILNTACRSCDLHTQPPLDPWNGRPQ